MGRKTADGLPVKDDFSLLRMVKAIDAVEEDGFAGSIGADDGEDFTFIYAKTHTMKGSNTTEGHVEVLDSEKKGVFACYLAGIILHRTHLHPTAETKQNPHALCLNIGKHEGLWRILIESTSIAKVVFFVK
jgi:hypothetical protein